MLQAVLTGTEKSPKMVITPTLSTLSAAPTFTTLAGSFGLLPVPTTLVFLTKTQLLFLHKLGVTISHQSSPTPPCVMNFIVSSISELFPTQFLSSDDFLSQKMTFLQPSQIMLVPASNSHGFSVYLE